jgi:hypothetical protein
MNCLFKLHNSQKIKSLISVCRTFYFWPDGILEKHEINFKTAARRIYLQAILSSTINTNKIRKKEKKQEKESTSHPDNSKKE